MPRRRFKIALILCVVAAVGFGAYDLLWGKHWQRLMVNYSWCRGQIDIAQDMLLALEHFRKDHGDYPNTLSELVPNYASATSPNWYYARIGPCDYQLWTTTNHWISSFDALVFRRSHSYPGPWDRDLDAIRIDNWIYLIGAQNAHLERVARVVPGAQVR